MNLNRRKFVLGIGTVLATSMLPSFGRANQPIAYDDFPALNFFNVHTNEKLNVKYRDSTGYIVSAMNEISDLFRDYRSGSRKNIDPRVIDRIFGINRYFGGNNVIELISGYRSPQTNAALHEKSNGVAKNSYHMQGKAADISLPKQHIQELYRIAKLQKSGGSGIYVRSNFVHVDSGPVRSW